MPTAFDNGVIILHPLSGHGCMLSDLTMGLDLLATPHLFDYQAGRVIRRALEPPSIPGPFGGKQMKSDFCGKSGCLKPFEW